MKKIRNTICASLIYDVDTKSYRGSMNWGQIYLRVIRPREYGSLRLTLHCNWAPVRTAATTVWNTAYGREASLQDTIRKHNFFLINFALRSKGKKSNTGAL